MEVTLSYENNLTNPTSLDIINSWDRNKYPNFMKYLESKQYRKFKENFNGKENRNSIVEQKESEEEN